MVQIITEWCSCCTKMTEDKTGHGNVESYICIACSRTRVEFSRQGPHCYHASIFDSIGAKYVRFSSLVPVKLIGIRRLQVVRFHFALLSLLCRAFTCWFCSSAQHSVCTLDSAITKTVNRETAQQTER
jgi:hypothetical protein